MDRGAHDRVDEVEWPAGDEHVLPNQGVQETAGVLEREPRQAPCPAEVGQRP